jgi:prenyltransferase beta subunit
MKQIVNHYSELHETLLCRLKQLLDLSVGSPQDHNLIDLAHAACLLFELEGCADEKPPRVLAEESRRIVAFIRSCFNSGVGSFALAPATDGLPSALCLTACYFAHRLRKMCGLDDSALSAELNACHSYLAACRSPKGGYASCSGEEPDLVHTHLAVTINKHSDRASDDGNRDYEGVQRLLARCRKGGGYAILPTLKPNAYAVRLALQLTSELDLPLYGANNIRKFIDALYDQNSGGYRGFASPSEVIVEGIQF